MSDASKRHLKWVACATFAGMFQGSGSFIYASNFAKYGFIANGVLGPGTLIAAIIAKLIMEISYYCKHKTWFKKEGSAWKNKEGKWSAFNVIAVVANGLTNFLYTVCMTFAWKFAKMGGLNQGVVSTLLSFSSVFNIFLFCWLFKERVENA